MAWPVRLYICFLELVAAIASQSHQPQPGGSLSGTLCNLLVHLQALSLSFAQHVQIPQTQVDDWSQFSLAVSWQIALSHPKPKTLGQQ